MMASRSNWRAWAMAIVACTSGRAIHAQQLRGIVRDSASGLPIPGAVVTLVDTTATAGARTVTNEHGEFRATLAGNGIRSARLVRLGFRPADVRLPEPVNGVVRMDVVMVAIPISLQPVS